MSPDIVTTGFFSIDSITTIHDSMSKMPGGAALYSGLGAAVFVPTGVVARIGDDYPPELLNRVKQRLDLSGVKQVLGETPRFGLSYNDAWQEEYNELFFGVGSDLKSSDFPKKFGKIKLLYVSVMPPEQQLKWISFARKKGFLVGSDTNAVFFKEFREECLKVCEQSDFFFPNEREAMDLAGVDSVEDAAQTLAKTGGIVSVKKGQFGAVTCTGPDLWSRPAFLRDPIDTTGAGDTFAGAFIGSYLKYNNPQHSLDYACAVASFTVTGMGALPLFSLSEAQVDQVIK